MNVLLPRPRLLAFGFALAVIFAASVPVRAELDPNDPAAELASFHLPEGFEANLFASDF